MADNVTLNSMAGGPVCATDDIAGVHYQIVKLAYGALDAFTLIDGANPMPVINSTPANMQTRTEGREAHDAAATAFPLRIAGRYQASPPKVSASGDVTELMLSQEGKLLDVHSTAAADTTNVNTNYTTQQTNTSLVSAPGANKRLVIVEIVFSTDLQVNMKLVEDTAGTPTTKWGPHYFATNGGIVVAKTYVPLSTNKNLGITTSGTANCTITLRTIIENV